MCPPFLIVFVCHEHSTYLTSGFFMKPLKNRNVRVKFKGLFLRTWGVFYDLVALEKLLLSYSTLKNDKFSYACA